MMKLVLMGDLHYHQVDETIPGWLEARDTFFQTFLGRFLELEADAHISVGDLTNYGHTSELQEVYAIVRKSGKTFYHAMGNHDLYAQTRREVLEISGQPRYHAITTDHAILVFLDTAKEMDFEDWGGWVDEEQLTWFEDVILASGSKPVIVFAHHPVHQTTTNSDKDKGSIHPSIDMWKILSKKDGVGIYVNGHTHIDSIVNQNNWTFVQLSACLDQHGLRIMEIDEEEIRISAVDLEDAALTDNVEMLYNTMKHFRHTANARGIDSDRECSVSLRIAAEH
ncbi:metallophosphoesterase family protein [Paenibacillus qinlingensis]|uniref:Phosphodiesterase n=1 Tax=Paenibacillus qinlingensis TaxID=1837343 RepID=A0ABU1NRY2_9BACL|nr:metallophosphoesterase family protein [Paenibacillus qinlingensis]MDR6550233.1 putative phosphodiesterase [Paenibacillus qinlingensis]